MYFLEFWQLHMDVLWEKMVLSPRNPWLPHKFLCCLWWVVDCLILYRSSVDNHRCCEFFSATAVSHPEDSVSCTPPTVQPLHSDQHREFWRTFVSIQTTAVLCDVLYSGLTNYPCEVFSGVLLMQDSVRFHAFHLVLMTLCSPLLNSPPLCYLPLCCWWSVFSLKG